MAETAQQEPTMEEILSSIRKIIADETGEEVAAAEPVENRTVEVFDADDDAFDDLELTVEDSPELVELTEKLTANAFDIDTESLDDDDFEEAVSAPEVFSANVEEDDDDVFEAELEEEDPAELTEPEEVLEAVQEAPPSETDEAIAAEPSEIPVFDDLEAFEAPLTNVVEEEVYSRISADPSPLADNSTADAAAGSLGKLLSKVEFGAATGGANTIEGLVRELLRPMLKEWLDANLPGIVDKHVEAEVQRIARLAR